MIRFCCGDTLYLRHKLILLKHTGTWHAAVCMSRLQVLMLGTKGNWECFLVAALKKQKNLAAKKVSDRDMVHTLCEGQLGALLTYCFFCDSVFQGKRKCLLWC